MVDRVVLRIDIELPRAVGSFRRRTLARDDEVVVAPHTQFFHLQFRDQHFAREHSHEQPFEVRHALFERAVRVRQHVHLLLLLRRRRRPRKHDVAYAHGIPGGRSDLPGIDQHRGRLFGDAFGDLEYMGQGFSRKLALRRKVGLIVRIEQGNRENVGRTFQHFDSPDA